MVEIPILQHIVFNHIQTAIDDTFNYFTGSLFAIKYTLKPRPPPRVIKAKLSFKSLNRTI